MVRLVAFNAFFFALPFLVYGAYLLATRGTVGEPGDWPPRIVGWLTGIGLLLILIGIVALITFGGAPPGEHYQPPELKDGRVVPGQFQ